MPGGALAATMLGWHLVIGVGEAVLTAAVVGAVAASRPDLVHALSQYLELEPVEKQALLERARLRIVNGPSPDGVQAASVAPA